MRAARAPEGRGINKRIAFVSAIIVALIAGVVVAYFSMGSDSISAKNEQATGSPDSVLSSPSAGNQAVNVGPAPTAEPTATPIPAPTSTRAPSPTVAPPPETTQNDSSGESPQPTPESTAQPDSATVPKVLPDAQFGEVLEDDFIRLKFPSGALVHTWYSFQVDTETQDITLFFAQYNDTLDSIASTVKVEQ